MKRWPLAALLLLLATGCASDYGAMEIRYSDYEIDSFHRFKDVRAHPAQETLTVQGRAVDDFCNSLSPSSGTPTQVPATAVDVVLIVPRRCDPETGLLLKVSADGEVMLLGRHPRKDSAEMTRVWTSLFWTQDTTRIWNRLIKRAEPANKAARH